MSQYKEKKYCIDCNKEIYLYSEARCKSCAMKKRWKNKKFRENFTKKRRTGINFPKCINCGKELKNYYAKRCLFCHYKYMSILMLGENNPMFGRKGKLSSHFIDGKTLKKYYCKICGKEISYQSALYQLNLCRSCSKIIKYKDSQNHPMKGKKHTKISKQKMSLSGGGTGIPYEYAEYGAEFDKELKEQIRYRDGYKCQLCGCPETECRRKLDVHHIDYDKNNLLPINLISLCHSCHPKTNHNRDYYYAYFMYITNQEII